MKSFEDNSIDLCLTDPPYGTTVNSWDTSLNLVFVQSLLKKVLKGNKIILLFGGERTIIPYLQNNLKNFKYSWIWEKENGSNFLSSKQTPRFVHEVIFVFKNISKGLKGGTPYFPVKGEGRPYNARTGAERNFKFRSKFKNHKIVNSGQRYPRSVLKFNSERGLHATQKPVPLLEYLIKTYTKEGDRVLDFTMGSGSTGVACKNLNRKFVGIEKVKKYFDIAKNRINEIIKL